jgi:hypothetical protein
MSSCSFCKSLRLLSLSGELNRERCDVTYNGVESKCVDVPCRVLGEVSILMFTLCLDCGRIQGNWPIPEPEIEYSQDNISYSGFMCIPPCMQDAEFGTVCPKCGNTKENWHQLFSAPYNYSK